MLIPSENTSLNWPSAQWQAQQPCGQRDCEVFQTSWDLNHNVYVLKRMVLAKSGFEDVHLGAAVALICKPP